MIVVRSYLGTPDTSFTDIVDAEHAPADPFYVDGAIELTIDDVEILDQGLWDLVDQLWAYICAMAQELVEKGYAPRIFLISRSS